MKHLPVALVISALLISCQAERARPEGDPPYDPKANAVEDVRQAVQQAAAEGKHVFVDIGGEWCSWCHKMDAFFVEHPELLALRKKNFVFVKVNFSDENENTEFFSTHPKVAGYPHIFILDARGRLLESKSPGDWIAGDSFDLTKFTAFLNKWAPN